MSTTISYTQKPIFVQLKTEEQLQYEGKKVIVSRTFPKDTTIVIASINNLPHDDEEILKAEMSKIFIKYEAILKMGLRFTTRSHLFPSRGFVILNPLSSKSHEKLVPQIASQKTKETSNLTFTGMNSICSCCHVIDHVLGKCSVIGQRFESCFIRNKPDHVQAECPDSWWNQ